MDKSYSLFDFLPNRKKSKRKAKKNITDKIREEQPSPHVIQNILSYSRAVQHFKHGNAQFHFLLN